ncbi:MAG: GHMP kinase [Chloroflexi bacterium]|nr:GHMP kinase [Chloroflexota bacterium]
MKGIASMPGTCGELVQGMLDGVPFHVSCPVDLYSHAEVRLGPERPLTFSPAFAKAGEAVKRALETLGRSDLGGRLTLTSELPRSKGMASSTADIAAAVAATALALGTSLAPRQIADLALSIEPTDGSVFPDIVLFDHLSGRLLERLGPPPPIDIIALDFGGEVDTIAFNKVDRSHHLAALSSQAVEALGMVRAGVALADPVLVGRGATLSARSNQDILYKPQLELVMALARQIGGAGVCVGHSGTVIGVLLDRRTADVGAAHRFLRQRLGRLERSFCSSLIGGGSAALPIFCGGERG